MIGLGAGEKKMVGLWIRKCTADLEISVFVASPLQNVFDFMRRLPEVVRALLEIRRMLKFFLTFY